MLTVGRATRGETIKRAVSFAYYTRIPVRFLCTDFHNNRIRRLLRRSVCQFQRLICAYSVRINVRTRLGNVFSLSSCLKVKTSAFVLWLFLLGSKNRRIHFQKKKKKTNKHDDRGNKLKVEKLKFVRCAHVIIVMDILLFIGGETWAYSLIALYNRLETCSFHPLVLCVFDSALVFSSRRREDICNSVLSAVKWLKTSMSLKARRINDPCTRLVCNELYALITFVGFRRPQMPRGTVVLQFYGRRDISCSGFFSASSMSPRDFSIGFHRSNLRATPTAFFRSRDMWSAVTAPTFQVFGIIISITARLRVVYRSAQASSLSPLFCVLWSFTVDLMAERKPYASITISLYRILFLNSTTVRKTCTCNVNVVRKTCFWNV